MASEHRGRATGRTNTQLLQAENDRKAAEAEYKAAMAPSRRGFASARKKAKTS